MTSISKYLFVFIILVCFNSCYITTSEQRKQFEACQQNLNYSVEIISTNDHLLNLPDSTLQFATDILHLDLEKLILKYQIQIDQIDIFLNRICQTADLYKNIRQFDIYMNNKTNEIEKKINESEKLLMDIDKIKPFNYDSSKYIKINVYDYDSSATN